MKAVMTRCIHCTRCVRFMSEIGGSGELGTTGRGTDTEIGTYVEKKLGNYLSGNVVDLCPVGALTPGSHAFVSRPWELESTRSVDRTDSLGSAVVMKTRKGLLQQVLPSPNADVNVEWLGDKSRLGLDGESIGRLDTVYGAGPDGSPVAISVEEGRLELSGLAEASGSKMSVVAGNDVEEGSLFVLQDMCDVLGLDGRYSLNGESEDVMDGGRSSIAAGSEVKQVGVRLLEESPVISTRLRSRWLAEDVELSAAGGSDASRSGGAWDKGLGLESSRESEYDALDAGRILGEGVRKRDGGASLAQQRSGVHSGGIRSRRSGAGAPGYLGLKSLESLWIPIPFRTYRHNPGHFQGRV